jgi:quercetin dioxygenase-like cupin family protein
MKRFLWSKLVQKGESFHIVRAALDGRNAAPPHKQDFPEVFWIEQGQTLHTVNGKQSLLMTGDIVFVRCTDSHSLAATPQQGFVLVNIAFPRATLDFIKARYFPSETRWCWKKGPLWLFVSTKNVLGWACKVSFIQTSCLQKRYQRSWGVLMYGGEN